MTLDRSAAIPGIGSVDSLGCQIVSLNGWQMAVRRRKGTVPAAVLDTDGRVVSRPPPDKAKAEEERLARLEQFKDVIESWGCPSDDK
jgi:hypothetical protein